MDSTVSISSDKQLRHYLGSLTKCMTGSLVQRMSNCLSQSRMITVYEEQVITSQPTDMQKASRLMQIVIKKGQSACSSFLTCLGMCDPVLYENVTGFPAQFNAEDHQHVEQIPLSGSEEKFCSSLSVVNIPPYFVLLLHERLPCPLSISEKLQFTPCIINIQNSSLNNCIIGNNNRQCITCDQHALLAENDASNVKEMPDMESSDQLIPVRDTSDSSVHMERSNIEYVIIGDYNSMTVTETSEFDEEHEPEVIG